MCVPAVVVWGDLVTNAADPQDIDSASSRILHGVLAVGQALGSTDMQLASTEGIKPVQLDAWGYLVLTK